MQEALVAVPGVRTADVSLESKLAKVSYDPKHTGVPALTAAVKIAGFGAEATP